MEIPLIQTSLSSDFGINDTDEIEYPILNPVETAVKDFKLIKVLMDTGMIRNLIPGPLYHFIQQQYVPRPIFSKKKCILCRKCIEICPASVLQIKNKKIAIDNKDCIRCYCCHEVCPADAIRIGRI